VPGWVRAARKADPQGFMGDVYLWWDQFNRPSGEDSESRRK
jgi:hypothetical protein